MKYMSARKVPLVTGEFYHIYNRGVDKRTVFSDESDLERCMKSLEDFNVIEPIGSIYEKSFADKRFGGQASKSGKLVNFVAYCVNPNHYHFLLEQVADNGIEKFMHRLGTGYTRYFNEKEKRSGSLFQGRFKAVHIDSNEYLLHASAYVNLNDRVHQLGGQASKLVQSRSSWGEYKGESKSNFCSKGIILEQFKNAKEYQKFAESSVEDTMERRADLREMERDLLE